MANVSTSSHLVSELVMSEQHERTFINKPSLVPRLDMKVMKIACLGKIWYKLSNNPGV